MSGLAARLLLALPSSSGQDAALSRRKQGFDSPWEYQTLPSHDGSELTQRCVAVVVVYALVHPGM